MKIGVFFEHGKDAHRNSAKGALNESSRSLIWSFWKQIVFLGIAEKCQNYCKMINFGYIPDGRKKFQILQKIEICGSEPCA